jgi:hypothetical protein
MLSFAKTRSEHPNETSLMCSLLHRQLTYGSAIVWLGLWVTVFPVYVSKTEIPDTNEGIPTMGMMVTFRRLGWRCSLRTYSARFTTAPLSDQRRGRRNETQKDSRGGRHD